ncbi:hypothetical protein HanOQP8_Chr16g0610111 [Helianthus annuus]|nr:hypothetical protein HanOQP8_Chr16g0610111 [Helianthus annuus]KAJ0820554.1 hypothetical protein HanPSC8_Chr16g0709341 [Helianthus annuus]
MEMVWEKIMSINQEDTVHDYCAEFEFLFDQVRNFEEISEFYGIYLFICGLEPEIRKIFARWHQYSCTKVKDVISLALKIDSNSLQDSFSPFDPNSSFYNKDLEFDINITLEELMKDNELFQNGKIQETIDGSDEMNGLGNIFVDESLENEKDEEVTDSENEIEIDDICNQESVVWKELEGEKTSKDIRFVIRSSSIRLDYQVRLGKHVGFLGLMKESCFWKLKK